MKHRAVILSILMLATFVPPATATGDCSAAYVRLYGSSDWTGRYVKLCYGVNDNDVSAEPQGGQVIGPDYSGVYRDDFDSILGTSGISSFYFDEGSTNTGLCIFNNKGYATLAQKVTTTGYYVASSNNQTESIAFQFSAVWCQ